MKVRKRDGRLVNFNESKIINAIQLASENTKSDNKITDEQLKNTVSFVKSSLESKGKEEIEVDEVHDLVEKYLKKENKDVAKSYIDYRKSRELERFKNLDITKKIFEKLNATNVVNQNANVDEFSFGGRKGEADSVLMKELALNYLISPKFAKNHNNNRIYIHDLDSYFVGMHNCAHPSTWINVIVNGVPKILQIKDFVKMLNFNSEGHLSLKDENIQILSRDGYTSLLNIWARKTNKDEKIYTIKTRNGLPLKLTGEHKIPIIRNNVEELSLVKDLKVGDELINSNRYLSHEDCSTSFLSLLDIEDLDLRICNSEKLYKYLSYKYDVYYTRYSKEHNLSNKHNIDINMTLNDLKTVMNDFMLDWDILSSLRIKSNGSKKSYPLFIPYSESLAKLYAYVYADGGVYVNEKESLYQLTFTNTNEEIMDDFVKCYKDVFGYTLKKSYPKSNWNSPCIRVTDGSRLIVKLFKDFAGAKKYGSADISVPDFVMNGSDSIKYAYLSACIDTDGCLSKDITYTTCGENYSEQIFLLLKGLGYNPVKVESSKKGSVYRIGTVSGIRNYSCFNIQLRKNNEKFEFYNKINSIKKSDKYSYKGISSNVISSKIVNIISNKEDTLVYDFETESHWFIANDYIVHNCLSLPIDDLLKNGMKTRQVFIRPANSLSTAMQLVAVAIQLQSLQQFGGVAVTHIDWSMIPYIRKSFFKHFEDGLKYVENKSDKEIEKINGKILEKDK